MGQLRVNFWQEPAQTREGKLAAGQNIRSHLTLLTMWHSHSTTWGFCAARLAPCARELQQLRKQEHLIAQKL